MQTDMGGVHFVPPVHGWVRQLLLQLLVPMSFV
jgi:hypothetical protein